MFTIPFCTPCKTFDLGTSVSGIGQRTLGSWMPCSPDAPGGSFIPLLGHREGLRALSPILYQPSSKSQILLFWGNFTWNSCLSSSCTLHLVYHDISSGKIFGKGEFALAQLKRQKLLCLQDFCNLYKTVFNGTQGHMVYDCSQAYSIAFQSLCWQPVCPLGGERKNHPWGETKIPRPPCPGEMVCDASQCPALCLSQQFQSTRHSFTRSSFFPPVHQLWAEMLFISYYAFKI